MYNTKSQMYNCGGGEREGHNEERLMIYGTPMSPNIQVKWPTTAALSNYKLWQNKKRALGEKWNLWLLCIDCRV